MLLCMSGLTVNASVNSIERLNKDSSGSAHEILITAVNFHFHLGGGGEGHFQLWGKVREMGTPTNELT